MNQLLKSRRFWTAVIGAVVTLTVYFVSKYAFAALEDVQMVLNVLLPIVLVLIAAYTVDDVTNTWTQGQIEIEQMRLNGVQAQVEALRIKGE